MNGSEGGHLVDRESWHEYLEIDPEGDFVEAIGRQHSAEQAAKIIGEHMSDWKAGVKVRWVIARTKTDATEEEEKERKGSWSNEKAQSKSGKGERRWVKVGMYE